MSTQSARLATSTNMVKEAISLSEVVHLDYMDIYLFTPP